MKKIFVNSRGQVAVLYAGIAAILIGAIALGSDVAVMYVNWQQMQKTADAAAIAGANYLAGYTFTGTPASGCTGEPDAATTAACTYAVDNGIAVSNLTLTEPTSTTIQVVAQESGLPYFFGKAIGLSTYNVAATAAAAAGGNIGTVSQGLFPVGLQCTAPCSLSSLDPGQSVSFGQKFVGGLAPGNWQWLNPTGGTGGGDSALSSAIESGDSASFSVGGSIESEPGNKGNSSNVKTALAARLSSCESIADPCSSGGGNPSDIPPGDPCLVVVPAVDYHGCTGNCPLTIEGFALIYLEPATTTSTNINGCFVKAIAANTIASSTAPALGGYQVPTLTQ
ncbi:pilus assembly protein TadG-related protein [Candidatus Binatus sp.]|uniref:pilus assembly protein TadG-related protein n=1 Tax=Candidatus Binatus sp. TaxID=2811406 RepID=UPI003BAED4B5